MFVTFMGWISIFTLVVCVLFLCIAFMTWGIGRMNETLALAVKEREYNRIGNSILSSSHWFGESKETARVLEIIGKAMVRGCGIDPSSLREEWRRSLNVKE